MSRPPQKGQSQITTPVISYTNIHKPIRDHVMARELPESDTGGSMFRLYGYSSLGEADYRQSVSKCNKYVSGSSPEIFYEIMSNKVVPCFDDSFGQLNYDPLSLSEVMLNDLQSIDFLTILDGIVEPTLINSEIPIFNSISSIEPLLRELQTGVTLSYVDAGSILCDKFANHSAKEKAGEIHLKLLSQMSFGTIPLVVPRKCSITCLGDAYECMDGVRRNYILQKMMLKIPIIASLLKQSRGGLVSIKQLMVDAKISGTTVGRRSSSVNALIRFIDRFDDYNIHQLCSNIIE